MPLLLLLLLSACSIGETELTVWASPEFRAPLDWVADTLRAKFPEVELSLRYVEDTAMAREIRAGAKPDLVFFCDGARLEPLAGNFCSWYAGFARDTLRGRSGTLAQLRQINSPLLAAEFIRFFLLPPVTPLLTRRDWVRLNPLRVNNPGRVPPKIRYLLTAPVAPPKP
jgi:hypothetical protein